MLADTIWRARCRLVSPGEHPLALELTAEALAELKESPSWWMFMKMDQDGNVTKVYDMPLALADSNRIQAPDGHWEAL